MKLVSLSSGFSQLRAHLLLAFFFVAWQGACVGVVARCCLACGVARCGLARLLRCYMFCTLAGLCGRSMWCCSGSSRVCPSPFGPLPDTELLPYVLSSLFLCSCPFCSQELLLSCSLAGCHTKVQDSKHQSRESHSASRVSALQQKRPALPCVQTRFSMVSCRAVKQRNQQLLDVPKRRCREPPTSVSYTHLTLPTILLV